VCGKRARFYKPIHIPEVDKPLFSDGPLYYRDGEFWCEEHLPRKTALTLTKSPPLTLPIEGPAEAVPALIKGPVEGPAETAPAPPTESPPAPTPTESSGSPKAALAASTESPAQPTKSPSRRLTQEERETKGRTLLDKDLGTSYNIYYRMTGGNRKNPKQHGLA
jgi:hypothetical protein